MTGHEDDGGEGDMLEDGIGNAHARCDQRFASD